MPSHIKILYHQVKPGLDCPDGIYSAYIAKLMYPKAKLIGCVYQMEPPQVHYGDTLIIVDFSFPVEVIRDWSDKYNCQITQIDHHKTLAEKISEYTMNLLLKLTGVYLQNMRKKIDMRSSSLFANMISLFDEEQQLLLAIPIFYDFLMYLKFTAFFSRLKSLPVSCDMVINLVDLLVCDQSSELKDLLAQYINKFIDLKGIYQLYSYFVEGDLIFDLNKCGAVLTWEYFFPKQPVPALLHFVDDRDLRRWRQPSSQYINEALSHLGRSFKKFKELLPLTTEELVQNYGDLGEALLNPKLTKAIALAQNAQWRNILGHRVLVVEINSLDGYYYNEVMAYLYDTYEESLFVATYMHIDDGYKFSFRSKQGSNAFDVSAIARQFGGGGHHCAAGARLKQLPW
jgi:hypothetical protein